MRIISHTQLLRLTNAALVVSKLKNPDSSTHTRISAFLSLIKPEKLSLITILEIMRLQGSGGIADGMKTARALIAVGRAVENEYKAEMCRKNDIQVPSHPRLDHGYFTHLGYRDLYQRRVAARKYMEDAEEWTSEWTQLLRVRVGSILVECLMDVATVTRTGINKRTGQEVYVISNYISVFVNTDTALLERRSSPPSSTLTSTNEDKNSA